METDNTNRRQALKKIGMALAAVSSIDALGLIAEAQQPDLRRSPIRLPATITLAPKQPGDFDVFVAHQGRDASVLVIPASDTQASTAAATALKASPAKATVVNGVIHVGLGAAGASRSAVARRGAIDFRGAAITTAALITR